MKKRNIYSVLVLSAALALGLTGCEDEVLVETKDNTKVDQLLEQIADADERLASLNVEENALIISNAAAEKKIAELAEMREQMLDPNSAPTEIHYTVNVLSASNVVVTSSGGSNDWESLGRKAGVEGASVIVEQNGIVIEPSSSADGLYLFKGLKEGYVYVRVSAADHSGVEYRAYIYINNGDDEATAEAYNSATQVVLYPVSGDVAAKVVGKAFANTTIVDDTLNRRFGSDNAIFGTKANTYVATPGNWNGYNYTHWNYGSGYSYNHYGTNTQGWNNPGAVKFENALAGRKIYAYPYVQTLSNNNYYTENGYIYEIIYKGLITSTTIAADGSFTLPVVAGVQYSDSESALINDIEIYADRYVAPHTRFTAWGGQYYGQSNEEESTEISLNYYNTSNTAVTVFTGTGTTTASLAAGKAVSVKRRVVTEDFWYNTMGSEYVNEIPVPGQTVNMNLYFFPTQKY